MHSRYSNLATSTVGRMEQSAVMFLGLKLLDKHSGGGDDDKK